MNVNVCVLKGKDRQVQVAEGCFHNVTIAIESWLLRRRILSDSSNHTMILSDPLATRNKRSTNASYI